MALRKFREIQIAEYRGIHELKLTLGEKGILVTGTNGVGKTSVVSAVRTLVQGGDVQADAVRNGAEKAVLVAFTEHEKIRRVITARSSEVTVTTETGGKLAKPQTVLDRAAGRLLDPLAVLSAKDPREAKKLVLETLDARTDLAALRAFAPSLPDHFDASGHAMEARARAERLVYDLRTTANAAAERAEGEAARADEVARAAAVGLPATWPAAETAGADQIGRAHV